MKKLLFVAAIAVFGMTSAKAQDINLGLNVGLPSADADYGYSLGVTLEANYLFEISDEFQAGPTAGYSHFLGKKISVPFYGSTTIDDAGFLIIGGAGRYTVSEDFTVGLDLGYGLGIAPEGNNGGVFYAPKVQYTINDQLDIVASYRGINSYGTFASINLGVELAL